MSDEIRIGDDGASDGGIEVRGGEPNSLRDLVDWTEQVLALVRAHALFPDLEAIVDDNGYTGPSSDPLTPSSGWCWLLCGSQVHAEQVSDYLEEHAEELDLVPHLKKNMGIVYITYYKFL